MTPHAQVVHLRDWPGGGPGVDVATLVELASGQLVE